MTTEESPVFTIPSVTIREDAEDLKPSVKPLYKLKIEDLLTIPFIEETSDFRFKNNRISLVMFGGKIESISSDDSTFAFYVSDGTGGIQCYYKCKEDIASLVNQINKFPHSNCILDTDIIHDISSSSDSDDGDLVEETDDTHVSKIYAEESEEIISDVFLWLNNEVIPAADEESRKVGDIIHVSGQLQESGSVRKVSVIDFRIVKNEIEHEDFLSELEYTYKNLY